MIEDVNEPLERFANFFKDAHARHTAEFFENLVRQSGVDERENIDTVSQFRQLEQQVATENSTNRRWKILRNVIVASFIVSLVYIYFHYSPYWLIAPVLVCVPALYKLKRVIDGVGEKLKDLRRRCDDKRAEAYLQMLPLNRLYDWDILAKLLQKTLPRVALDPYFSNGRLRELREAFGWDARTDEARSILFAHSGVINGNPFVLARALDHWMGTKTYHGSMQISWTEQVRDAQGKWHTETRYETLRASVEKPFPEYANRTFIVYGNEAAPDLCFSRNPSALSSLEDGIIGKWRKGRAIKKLESRSRDLGAAKTFTLMSNKEFDALFGATDRDHEVQFRLLFTPLAQQEMLKLLKDHEHGYGDDFGFVKERMVNFVEPGHMSATDIDASPVRFEDFDLARARQFFNRYHNDFFRSFYFGIAPLLAIPLYQQHRSHIDIYRDAYATQSCNWEHEAIANFYGERQLQHARCTTRSILKTSARTEPNGTQTVNVTASGFCGEDRLTRVPVRGGDGRTHQVPVSWTEYIGVQRTSSMLVREQVPPVSLDEANAEQQETPDAGFPNAVLRRSIYSALQGVS